MDWRQLPNRPSATLQAVAKYPEAKRFDDWRIMLQEMDKKIDAVVVCTADHKAGRREFRILGHGLPNSSAGNIAIRNKGKLLRFDAKKERFTGEAANRLIHMPYREGRALPK